MQLLNLPAYEYKIRQSADQHFIFDNIRKKFVILTPEEWVRQHFINYLTGHRQYPKGLISVERGTVYNQLAKRTDIRIYGTDAQALMLVECKASTVPITAAVVKQVSTYNKTIRARFVVLTNGLEHFCWEINWQSQQMIPLSAIPAYPDLGFSHQV
ncbi:type I restriction enzyme HsdR N-terminal domain-containing protein [Adhaeribacter aquaticus]|uniref:type I restriction enzyme HsdR N-terminal domain-containing protein n=1 Tax=Adhaeribacter aquaticus TaxID=299567 RepID=UPI00047A35DD|nr:type I restriction enzyme HsdR N-terminal domain-containing protein [Adhaeribacter aquaticus]